MQEKDSRLKYIEIPQVFGNKASVVDFHCKASQRACERMAKHLSKAKPKTQAEFERVEYLKDFVVKTSQNNEATLELLTYIKGLLADVSEDAKVLVDGSTLRDTVKFQSDTIKLISQQRDELVNEISGRNKKNS